MKTLKTLLLLLLTICITSTQQLQALTPTSIQSEVTQIQATPATIPGLPTGQDPRGFVGSIISSIFNSFGYIRNEFIQAFANVSTFVDNAVLVWDDSADSFRTSSITDNGSTVNINNDLVVNANQTVTGDQTIIGDQIVSGNQTITGSLMLDPSSVDPNGIIRIVGGYSHGSIGSPNLVGNPIIIEDAGGQVAHIDGNGTMVRNGPFLLSTVDAENIQFGTNDTTRMTLTSTGHLGIGTVNPRGFIHVIGGRSLGSISSPNLSDVSMVINDDSTQTTYIDGNGMMVSSGSFLLAALGDTAINFGVNQTEQMRLVDGGLGIGTPAPSETLDVDGKIRMRTQTQASDSGDIVATKEYVDTANSCTLVNAATLALALGDRPVAGNAYAIAPQSIGQRCRQLGYESGFSNTIYSPTQHCNASNDRVAVFVGLAGWADVGCPAYTAVSSAYCCN